MLMVLLLSHSGCGMGSFSAATLAARVETASRETSLVGMIVVPWCNDDGVGKNFRVAAAEQEIMTTNVSPAAVGADMLMRDETMLELIQSAIALNMLGVVE